MTRLGRKLQLFASFLAVSAVLAVLGGAVAQAQAPVCSVWLIESSRFMKVPFGAFMPDRAFVPGSTNPSNNIPTVDLPVNIGVIKCGNELILYDTGWKQQDYLKMTGSEHWAPIGEQLKVLGFNAADVTKVVIGHAHWDHAGQLSDLPNAVLYVQKQELAAIEWALNYPEKHIRAINSDPGGCNRTPACGYMPLTMEEVYGKVLKGKAVIVDGEMEIAARRDHPSGLPRPHRRLAAARSADQHRQAGVRLRRLLVLRGDPRLDGGQRAADRLGPAVPCLREVLQDHRRL